MRTGAILFADLNRHRSLNAETVDQLADRIRAFVSGTLKPSVNLRELAMEYDKPTILQQWESLLIEHSLQLT